MMATEKRLIDANEIPWEEHYVPDLDSNNQWDYKKELCVLKPVIDQLPTVDAVEVVRCKDCIHWYETEGVCLKIYSDGAVSSYAWQDRNPDDFCSYGERKCNAMKKGDREKVRELILQAIREWHELSTDVSLTSYIAEWLLQNDLAFVVCCEDCKYRVLDTVSGEDWCNHTLGLCSEVYATDFCCHGERKDND